MSLALIFAGCATVRYGGAPEPAFNYEKDLKELEELFAPAASIKEVGANPNDTKRNSFIDGRIALYNIRYVRFVRDLGVDKQQLDAASDILLLGLSLAAASTGSLRSATNLATAMAGVTGARITIDKHFYFDKTIQALVSTMNAQRKLILVRILSGRSKTITEYPLTRALDDLSDYEQAGTLLGAINTLQADAADNEKAADKELRKLELPTRTQFEEKEKLATALESLGDDTPKNLETINKILTELGFIQADKTDFTDAARTLSDRWREARLATLQKWRTALKNASVDVKD
ncbi:MAG: hypothetical protein Q8S00_26725 [Deltaproteobacteria bacterium]|nr:hypothetical protein [Deltaproteobacteria bacterium]MDZ4347392.1 hypothetical protein [Candidatus Binatia bacterium]